MNCPVCDGVRMREVEKENVLIDTCPNCKGVWLDRGELEKITKGLQEEKSYYDRSYESDDRYYRESSEYPKKKYDRYGYPSKHKRKKSMMDIFSDFL